MMRLLTRLMILPLEVIVSSMEAFSKAMREIQKTFGEGIIDPAPAPASAVDEALSDGPSVTTHSEIKLPDNTPTQSSSIVHEHNRKEKVQMADQDLSGSDLKLVRYKVLFTKRDYEHAFPEKEELVHDDMECNRFIAWKIAEFVQALKKEEDGVRRIPEKWATYLINEQKRKLTEPERTKIENDFDQEMSKDA